MSSTRWCSAEIPASARRGSRRTWPVCPPTEAEKLKTLWNAKPDDWGNPLRPANLNRGVYKGGRRPLDIFWRIAKGINGAQMPAHYPSPLDDKKVWDLVNFVLALPYEPELLRDAPPAPAAPAALTAARERIALTGLRKPPGSFPWPAEPT